MFDMIVHSLGEFMLVNYPYSATIFGMIGLLLTLVTALDKLLPALGLAKKLQVLFDVPFLGAVLNYMLRFSAIRTKKPNEP